MAVYKPKKYFQTQKPKSSGKILCSSQKISRRTEMIGPPSHQRLGMENGTISRAQEALEGNNIASQKALLARLDKYREDFPL